MEFGEDIVDGRNPAQQLRLVIHPVICSFFLHLRWFAGFLPSAVSSMHTFEPSKSAFLMEFLIRLFQPEIGDDSSSVHLSAICQAGLCKVERVDDQT